MTWGEYGVNLYAALGVVSPEGQVVGDRTYSVGDAIGEAHELDLVLWTLPGGIQGQDQSQSGGLRVCGAVGEGDVSQGWGSGLKVGGAHGGGGVWERKVE